MLTTHKLKIIQDLVAGSSKEELIWLNGYLSAVISGTNEETEPRGHITSHHKITIAYGTETGNSKKLAAAFAAKAKGLGMHAKLISLDQYRLNDLLNEEYFFTVISTQGEGEPPAAAKKFYDHIHQNNFRLDKLKYGVLALGDTAYPLFCKAGEDVDTQLQHLGAERIISLGCCDTDYEQDASDWFSHALQKVNGSQRQVTVKIPETAKKTSGKKMHAGIIVSNINLNDRGSEKQTHHIEILSDAEYQPGDSIGMVPKNAHADVEKVIALSGIDADQVISHRDVEMTVFDLLTKKLNITFLAERVVKKYAQIVQQDIPQTKIGLPDLLKIYPVKNRLQFEEVFSILEPTTPRLYSVSSAPAAHPGEVHLTVARDSFFINQEIKHGLCSDLLSKAKVDDSIEFYVHKNDQFSLPAEERDLIMIGPGTGIAPFRSFLAERDATGATGRNWLFFGDRNFRSDFLYQTEIQNWLEMDVLTKVSLAFSRDQPEKKYVQHKMRENGVELFNWIHSGASLYICGARSPMSTDVEVTLLEIVQKHGQKNETAAVEFLNMMKDEGRFLKDVY
jgi:sulfite reductase (NADPH) flavoprotein alpha-component